MARLTTTVRASALAGVAALGLAASISTAGPPEPPRFQLIDLGTLGGLYSRALGMNEHGAIVGHAMTAEDPVERPHAFLWDRGVMHDLGSLGGDWAEARDVNVHLQAVGLGTTPEGEWHGIYWYDGIIFDLNMVVRRDAPPPISARRSACWAPLRVVLEANAINDAGEIAACGLFEGDDAVHALLLIPEQPVFRREPHYRWVDLGRLPGPPDCIVHDVDELGRTIGVSGHQAFQCDEDHTMRPLESWADHSVALAMNDVGTAVGWSGESGMQPLACQWMDGRPIGLPTPTGWISMARAVNQAGFAVGWIAADIGEPPAATLWEGCMVTVLRPVTEIPPDFAFVWDTFEEAVAIDDRGWIAGTGLSTDGRMRAFLLVPWGEAPLDLVTP